MNVEVFVHIQIVIDIDCYDGIVRT